MEMLSSLWQTVQNVIGGAHPVWLFFALALLPLVGAPISPLWIAVGMRFSTVPGFALALGALLVNYTLGYWLARRWLRIPLQAFVERRGWRLPQFSSVDEALVILLLRVTPGVPLFAQNYLLGLAEVSFGRYLLLSVAVQGAHVLAFVWFGHSLAAKAIWRVVLGAGALVALTLLVVLLRRWLKARSPINAPASPNLSET